MAPIDTVVDEYADVSFAFAAACFAAACFAAAEYDPARLSKYELDYNCLCS